MLNIEIDTFINQLTQRRNFLPMATDVTKQSFFARYGKYISIIGFRRLPVFYPVTHLANMLLLECITYVALADLFVKFLYYPDGLNVILCNDLHKFADQCFLG